MNSKISVIALAIASCANAPWAIAQTDTAGASASLDDRSVGTEDIIVTARRRQESILRIPVSETVVSGAALEKFYAFGGTWDKRLTYEAWIAFARMLVVRSEAAIKLGGNRELIAEQGTMPRMQGDNYVNYLGMRLHPIPTIIDMMP